MKKVLSRGAAAILALLAAVSPAAGAKPTGVILPFRDLKWAPEVPGSPVQMVTLWGDRKQGEAAVLIKVPAGWQAGVHAHTADYDAVTVAGTWIHSVQATGAREELPPGSFWAQPRFEMHDDRCKEGAECIVFVHSDDKIDLIKPSPSAPKAGGSTATMIPADKAKWAIQTPGLPIQISTLWGNRDTGPFGELIKLPGGFASRLHAHTGAYRGVLIKGTWIHSEANGAGDGEELTPGSYVFQPGKGMHIDRCKAGTECLLFEYQTEKPDILWPQNR